MLKMFHFTTCFAVFFSAKIINFLLGLLEVNQFLGILTLPVGVIDSGEGDGVVWKVVVGANRMALKIIYLK